MTSQNAYFLVRYAHEKISASAYPELTLDRCYLIKDGALLNNGMSSKRCNREIYYCTGMAMPCPSDNHPVIKQRQRWSRLRLRHEAQHLYGLRYL